MRAELDSGDKSEEEVSLTEARLVHSIPVRLICGIHVVVRGPTLVVYQYTV